MKVSKAKVALVIGIIALVILMVFFDISAYLSFSSIKAQQDTIAHFYQQHPISFPAVFFLAYVMMTAVSFPGAAIMTLLAGALFGVILGSIIVSFASTLGATLAFLTARYLFQEGLQSQYGDYLKTINEGIEKEGAYYLLTLRLVPLFPFFVINLLMGLTKIRISIYYWISQLGMLPATVIYVNAGTQLASLDSLSGILSPQVLSAFVLLGVFPIVVKKLLQSKSTDTETV